MPTEMSKVEEWSGLYAFLKKYVDFCFRFYFKTTVKGAERLNGEGTFIIAPNHQNALMDALAVLSVKRWQPVFLARADIFQNPTIRKILTFLKIMPVFRMRDGYGSLSQNDATFRKTMDVLRNRNGLVILPEGNHGEQKRLRPLKKGIARIAFQAEDEANGSLNLRIIPVGLDYTHYIRVGSHLHIRFGVPIRVAPLLAQYRENPARGYNALIELLEAGMRQEMVHIADEKYHNPIKCAIENFAKWQLKRQKKPVNHESLVSIQQKAARGIERVRQKSPDEYLVLMALLLEFERDLQVLGTTPWMFPLSRRDRLRALLMVLVLLALLPVFMLAFVTNLLPLAVIVLLTRRVKDLQFLSSFRFGLSVLLFPVFHVIQLVVFALLSPGWLYTAGFAIALPLTVFFFFWWKRRASEVAATARLISSKYLKGDVYSRAKVLHGKITAKLSKL